MLNIINNLEPFFEDCYRRISVREYAKLIKISPPTASNLLKSYHKQGLLNKEEERLHLFFSANRENKDLIDLSRIYWRKKLNPILINLKEKLVDPTVILFGSLAKAEVKEGSDVDLAIFAPEKKVIDLTKISIKLNRVVSTYWFKSIEGIKNEHLKSNILNGYILIGRLK